MKKVSVIIPFYNQKLDFLKQAVDSVLTQTLEDIEIICIDDGSDNSECFDFLKNFDEIKLIKTEHLGAGNARNIGIDVSCAENIMFLDSDDFYPENNTIEKLYNLKQEHKVLLVGGKHKILNNRCFEEPYFNFGDINEFFCNKKINYKDYQFPWWYWCFMFDSKLIKENKIFFPNYLRYQDPPFFVRVMNKAELFYAADFVSYIHRNSNKLYEMSVERIEDHVSGIVDLLKYTKENELYKLHSLLYDTFFDFDIKLFDYVSDLSKDKKIELINKIKSQNF